MENSEWQGKLYHDYSGEDKSCIYCGFYSEEDCKHENILESRPEYECDAGRVMKYCSRCGFVFEDYYVDGWHEYDENGNCIYCGTDSQECRHSFVVEKSYGDCTTVYLIVYYCEKCGYYKEDKTYFSEHQIGDDGFCTVCHKSERFDCMHPDLSIKETDATCQNEGWVECRCDSCGMMESVVTVERLPHDYNSQNICNSCGRLNPDFCGHENMVEDIYGNECNGYHYKSYCPDCYYSFEEYRSGKGHSYNSEGQCTVCGAYDQENCKHDFEILGAYDGDCLLSVNCELYCRKCEYRTWESRTFESHSFDEFGRCTVCHINTDEYCEHKNKETITHGEPSCMHETSGEVYCNDCGRMAKFIQPPSDHDYDEQGYCRFCGEHISWSCPHDNKNVQEEIEGNCCQPGSVIYHCPDCNNVFSESTEYGDHEYDEYGNCRFCGQSEGTVGECLGEAKTERLDIGIYNDFTYIGQYLLRTDYGYVERINVKGRWNYVSDEVIEVMLSVNGEYFSIRLIMKDGMFFEEGGESECKHEYTEIIGMAAPTCEEDGFHTYRCNACGYEFTESIPAQGHSFMDGRCELCGKTEGENDRYVVSDIEFEGARYVLYSDYAAERFVKSEDGKEYCEKGRWKYINASLPRWK